MHTRWTPPYRWVFGAATLLGLFSTLQAHRLTALNDYQPEIAYLLVLNLALWYIPASLTPIIFALTRRYPVNSPLPRLIAIHVSAVLIFSCIHASGMTAVRAVLFGAPKTFSWLSALQRLYLTNLDWALMTYTTIVGVTYALGYYHEAQARALKESQLEARLAEARLKTLEAELQPHFLFNTLHAISTLVHTNPDAADRMISRLSDLLRLTFDRSGAARVPLQEELEFLEKYLEIEQTRFQDRLTVHYSVDAETLDAEVPRLILQPLVENAIKHGVSPRSGDGVIEICSRREGDGLWLEVRDNGVGLTGRARHQLHSGVGLANTRDRLECLYGDAQRLEFSEERTGLAVRIRLPFSLAAVPPTPSAILVA
jgi:two-component system, LytTR family, sensor kinase